MTAKDVLRTADLLKASYLLSKGCRLLESQVMDRTTFFCFEGKDRCQSFLFEIAEDAPVGIDTLMKNFQKVKTALREAREANAT